MTKSDRIRQLIAEGWTCQSAIAREVGCNKRTVWQVFNPDRARALLNAARARSPKIQASEHNRYLRRKYRRHGWTEAEIQDQLKAYGHI